MPRGPGKYDEVCSEIREKTEASGIILVVIGGNKGEGFSIQGNDMLIRLIPELLHSIAESVEEDIKEELDH